MSAPIPKTKTILVTVLECPRCGKELVEERDPDARTMWHWKCNQECGYKY